MTNLPSSYKIKKMRNTSIVITVPSDFNFWRTVYSHGWCVLLPFRVDKDKMGLSRVIRLNNGTIVDCKITSDKNTRLNICARSTKELSKNQISEIKDQIGNCLRLRENFSDFYNIVNTTPKYRWISKAKSGRLLRAPSVFEDIIKMICTTNCSWALTEIMVENLVGDLGETFDGNYRSFPLPEKIAEKSEKFLRKRVRAGYRAPFILEFADKVASGKIDVESWRSSDLPTEELYRQLRSIKGVGNYAAGNILKLLGRYDYLGLDSWVRSRYYELYHNGRQVSDKTIERRYAQYGKWRGLIFWLEMTKHWFEHKFPF